MKKINFFDLLCLISFIALTITLGVHLLSPNSGLTNDKIEITVKLNSDCHRLEKGDVCKIDGRFCAEVYRTDAQTVTLTAYGSRENAGYLICGGKYLALCQPIKFDSGKSSFSGRVIGLEVSI